MSLYSILVGLPDDGFFRLFSLDIPIQTVHTLSLLNKPRTTCNYVYVITDENFGWILAIKCGVYWKRQGEHIINIDPEKLVPTCELLPVGIDGTVLSIWGREWNLSTSFFFPFQERLRRYSIAVDAANNPSSLDGLVSTSNPILSSEVWIKRSRQIYCVLSCDPGSMQ